MKHFGIITNINKDPELLFSSELSRYIENKGGTAHILKSTYHPGDGVDFTIEDVPAETEIFLVLGGDGTLIRAATKVHTLELPLVGVNLGHLGYLCELERQSVYPAIDRIMRDEYTIEDRIMLKCHKQGTKETVVALNDVVIHPGSRLKMLDLNVYVNGDYLCNYHADGIIIATPTGSTGYNMSAGGPIVDPVGDMILLTPNNAHTLNAKSIVLNGDAKIEIELTMRRSGDLQEAFVSCDGDQTDQFCSGERMVIRRDSHRVHICKLHSRSFLDNLSRKMDVYQ